MAKEPKTKDSKLKRQGGKSLPTKPADRGQQQHLLRRIELRECAERLGLRRSSTIY